MTRELTKQEIAECFPDEIATLLTGNTLMPWPCAYCGKPFQDDDGELVDHYPHLYAYVAAQSVPPIPGFYRLEGHTESERIAINKQLKQRGVMLRLPVPSRPSLFRRFLTWMGF